MTDTFTIYDTQYDCSFKTIAVKAFQSAQDSEAYTLEDARIFCEITLDFESHKSSIAVTSAEYFDANIAFAPQILIAFARSVQKTYDAYDWSHDAAEFRAEDTLDELPNTFTVEYA